ncbi:hypothetical protein BC828DRAFT_408261 [Blastocladiella britannica]|nr:hypothetical protein BC828DRAFT_408261 [Blastocladiella britannica]
MSAQVLADCEAHIDAFLGSNLATAVTSGGRGRCKLGGTLTASLLVAPGAEELYTRGVLAIKQLVDERLYRFNEPEAYLTLEPYFRTRFSLSRAQVYRYINCATVVADLLQVPPGPAADALRPLPLKQRVAKAVKDLAHTPAGRQALWGKALELQPDRTEITSTNVFRAAAALGISTGKVDQAPVPSDLVAAPMPTVESPAAAASTVMAAEATEEEERMDVEDTTINDEQEPPLSVMDDPPSETITSPVPTSEPRTPNLSLLVAAALSIRSPPASLPGSPGFLHHHGGPTMRGSAASSPRPSSFPLDSLSSPSLTYWPPPIAAATHSASGASGSPPIVPSSFSALSSPTWRSPPLSTASVTPRDGMSPMWRSPPVTGTDVLASCVALPVQLQQQHQYQQQYHHPHSSSSSSLYVTPPLPPPARFGCPSGTGGITAVEHASRAAVYPSPDDEQLRASSHGISAGARRSTSLSLNLSAPSTAATAPMLLPMPLAYLPPPSPVPSLRSPTIHHVRGGGTSSAATMVMRAGASPDLMPSTAARAARWHPYGGGSGSAADAGAVFPSSPLGDTYTQVSTAASIDSVARPLQQQQVLPALSAAVGAAGSLHPNNQHHHAGLLDGPMALLLYACADAEEALMERTARAADDGSLNVDDQQQQWGCRLPSLSRVIGGLGSQSDPEQG